jgi:hypothetical protein
MASVLAWPEGRGGRAEATSPSVSDDFNMTNSPQSGGTRGARRSFRLAAVTNVEANEVVGWSVAWRRLGAMEAGEMQTRLGSAIRGRADRRRSARLKTVLLDEGWHLQPLSQNGHGAP